MRHVDVITLDGPAGSGKSTVSRLLARRIGYAYLDTGAMYRAIALAAKREGVLPDDRVALRHLCENIRLRFVTDQDPPRLLMGNEDISEEIRNPEMDMLSSTVSTVKEVREAMSTLQRSIARHVGKGLVAEGRDMGTVVFPEARCKILLTASLEERASRRHRELLDRGKTVTKKEVMEGLKKRDYQDQNRSLAPLKAAPDALILDTTGMGIEAVLRRLIAHVAAG
ncbi:cytidylate kinase [delta proteobacterium NaphS2]|nr:cytidylate kinase [delta proteobacterium NaphS2]